MMLNLHRILSSVLLSIHVAYKIMAEILKLCLQVAGSKVPRWVNLSFAKVTLLFWDQLSLTGTTPHEVDSPQLGAAMLRRIRSAQQVPTCGL